MGLRNILANGVKIADKVTKDAQSTVTFERCTNSNTDGQGTKVYASAVRLKAIVEPKIQNVVTPSGELAVARVSIIFLDKAALVTATKGNGIKDDDRITMPSGETSPIMGFGGFMDRVDGLPLATEVYLG